MDFYFNIVTVVNFLTSVINAIVLTVCYRKHKVLLLGIVKVAREILTHPKETQALQLSDDVFTTDNPVMHVNSGTTDTQTYSYAVNISYCISIYACTSCIILDICVNHQTSDE